MHSRIAIIYLLSLVMTELGIKTFIWLCDTDYPMLHQEHLPTNVQGTTGHLTALILLSLYQSRVCAMLAGGCNNMPCTTHISPYWCSPVLTGYLRDLVLGFVTWMTNEMEISPISYILIWLHGQMKYGYLAYTAYQYLACRMQDYGCTVFP